MSVTTRRIAYDRAGPRGGTSILLIHAGVADRRMWDPQWDGLSAEFDVVRPDLRGFGESSERPSQALSHLDDMVNTLTEVAVGPCHVVGASLGAGVAVELAVARPDLVASLLLATPGGSLIANATADLLEFFSAERAALAAHDLDAAVEANVATWVDGPHRTPDIVDPDLRALVGRMQRRAFEITADWTDVNEAELEPPALDRLADLEVPTLVLGGALDVDAALLAADAVADGIGRARRVDWADVGHLPSLERPEDFLALVHEWVVLAGSS